MVLLLRVLNLHSSSRNYAVAGAFVLTVVAAVLFLGAAQTSATQTVTVLVLQSVGAQPGPIPAGTPFVIEYWTDPTVLPSGTATAFIATSQQAPHLWDSGAPVQISGGLDYDFNVPGISTPGNYFAFVTVVSTSGSFASTGAQSFTVTGQASGSGVPFDFTLALVPSTVTVTPGETATYQVSITYSDPSYSGTEIDIQVSGLGPGMDYQVSPSPPTLIVSTTPSTPAGTYTVALVGSANGVSHEADASLVVQPAQQFDFSISVSPSSQTVTPGASASFTVNVGLVSGSAQSITLTLSGTPTGVSGSFNPTSGTPPFTSSLTITSASSATGSYQLTVTGSGGGVTHQATLTLTVSPAPDFQVTAAPPSQTVLQGQVASYTVVVHGLNGFSSEVSLAVSGAPSGTSPVFSVPSGTPDFNSTLTIPIPATAIIGPVTLTVTASGGGESHQTNLVLVINPAATVEAASESSTEAGQSTGNLGGMFSQTDLLLIGAVIVLVALLAVVMLRRRKSSGPATGQGPATDAVFCSHCGTQNSTTHQFCEKCGAKL